MKKLSIATSLLLGLALSASACGKDKKAPAATPAAEPAAPAPAAPAPAAPTAGTAPAAPAAPAADDKPKADEPKAGGW